MRRLLVVCCFALGCGERGLDGDGGRPLDAGQVDAGPADAGRADAGPSDDPFLPDGGYSVTRIDAGMEFAFTEGPLWLPAEGALLFTDIPNARIWRLGPSGSFTLFRAPSGAANGLALDVSGALLAAEHGNRRVSRTLADGGLATLVDRWDGGRLNSPNDLIVRSDGTLYFTDPPYGVSQALRELSFQGVFRVDPSGTLSLIAADMNRPNGIALSPDEKVLYVSDTATSLVRQYTVNPDGTPVSPVTFTSTTVGGGGGGGDGVAIDDLGNVYVTTAGGVKVFRPDGGFRGRIVLPQEPANVSFGDADRRSLYATSRTGLYRVRLQVPGLP
jgi:gluconolactonase